MPAWVAAQVWVVLSHDAPVPAPLGVMVKVVAAVTSPKLLPRPSNEATVKGSCSHDKTGRHCLANDPNGKLNIPREAGYWLRDDKGQLTKKFRHICWDGCMFSNETMMKPQTWNEILATMIAVREAHGWSE